MSSHESDGKEKKMKRYMRKSVSFVLILALIFSVSATAFAVDNTATMRKANETAKTVRKVIGNENVSSDFIAKQGQFYLQKNDTEFVFPQNGNGNITLGVNTMPNISISLPNQTKYKNGVLAEDGTVVYDSLDKDYSVAIQAIEKSFDGISINELRTSVALKNKNAPAEYSFKYDLPHGYLIMGIEEYLKTYATDEEKEYLSELENVFFILNQSKQIVYTIDGLKAVDSEGNLLASHSTIDGNKITQSIEIGENTNFPIVLYNSTHPDKKETRYLNKNEIKAVRDRYAGSSIETLVAGIKDLGVSVISAPIGYLYSVITIAVTMYDQYTYSTWNTFYETVLNNKNYNYLRTITRYHYHPGKGTYYPADCDYAYVKKVPK